MLKSKVVNIDELYEKKAVDIAAARKDVEDFIKSQEEQSEPNFLGFIDKRLRVLKNTSSQLADIDILLPEILEHIDKVLIYIQAMVEADKNSVSSVISRELKRDKYLMFKELLRESTENYADVNKKVNHLSQIVKELTSQNVKSKEDIFQYIELIKNDLKNYSNSLYDEVNKKIDEIRDNNLDSAERLQQQYFDIIDIIQSEKNNIENDMKTFQPLVTDIIHTELDEKGTFIDLLTNKIIQISDEKDIELQKKFKKIVEHIVGKGTQSNDKIARENTIKGLKSLNEVEVDEILGTKILKIVDSKSGFGNALANIGNRINQIVTFGGKEDTAKNFFDGFSFSIYYYKVIIQDGCSFFSSDTLLPIDLKQSTFNYISEFEKSIQEIEKRIKGYRYIKRSISKTINNEDPLEICCFIRIIESKKAYFILSQEPSSFFQEQIDKIISKKYKDKNIGEVGKKLKELSENYKIPKVDVAIFNSIAFELPSDDGKSVVTSKTGEKYLNAENEQELLILLDDIEENINKKRSLFNRNKEYHGNKNVWYYWATPNKKYLAVKMLSPLSDKDREKFCNYVEKNIWNNLVNTKSLSEMQNWLNTFIQKDAGVLANNLTLFGKIRTFYNGLIFVSILFIFIMVVIYYRSPNWLLPDLRLEVSEIKRQYQTEYNDYNESLKLLKSKFDDTSKIFKEEIKNISDKSSAKLELLELSDEAFKFSYGKTELSDLSNRNDFERLAHIAEKLKNLQNECKIIIIIYNNEDNGKNLNMKRAQKIKEFLTGYGVPNSLISISTEIEKQIFPGVRLKLML